MDRNKFKALAARILCCEQDEIRVSSIRSGYRAWLGGNFSGLNGVEIEWVKNKPDVLTVNKEVPYKSVNGVTSKYVPSFELELQ